MSNTLQWHRLRWPREVEAERLTVMSAVLATSGGAPVVVETIGRAAGVEHRLGLPVRRSEAIVEQLRNAVPGLGLHLIERQPINANRAIELRLSTPMRSLRSQQSPSVSRALLTALSLSGRGEQLVLQWQLLTSLPPRSVGSTEHAEPSPASVADVLLGRVGRLDAEARQALRAKRELPVWRALGRIAVRAGSTAREEALLREVVAALCGSLRRRVYGCLLVAAPPTVLIASVVLGGRRCASIPPSSSLSPGGPLERLRGFPWSAPPHARCRPRGRFLAAVASFSTRALREPSGPSRCRLRTACATSMYSGRPVPGSRRCF